MGRLARNITEAWGALTWVELERASWALSEPLQCVLLQSPAALGGIASQSDVDALSAKRAARQQCSDCIIHPAGETKKLFSLISGIGAASSDDVAQSFAKDRPPISLGLHRQMWLHRLSTR